MDRRGVPTRRLRRLTLRILGTEVLHVSTEPEVALQEYTSLDGGTTTSYPIGFDQGAFS